MYVHIYVPMRPCVHVLPAGREIGVVGSIYRIPRTEHTIYWASTAPHNTTDSARRTPKAIARPPLLVCRDAETVGTQGLNRLLQPPRSGGVKVSNRASKGCCGAEVQIEKKPRAYPNEKLKKHKAGNEKLSALSRAAARGPRARRASAALSARGAAAGREAASSRRQSDARGEPGSGGGGNELFSLSYIITRVAPHCVNTLRILHTAYDATK